MKVAYVIVSAERSGVNNLKYLYGCLCTLLCNLDNRRACNLSKWSEGKMWHESMQWVSVAFMFHHCSFILEKGMEENLSFEALADSLVSCCQEKSCMNTQQFWE